MKSVKRTIGIVTAIMAAITATIFGANSGASADESGPGTTATATIALGTHNTLRGAATFHNFAGVIGWQEVNDPADRDKMRRQLGDGYRHYVPAPAPAKAVPISWRVPRFTLVDSGYKKTHDGESNVTPARYITWVILKVNATGKKFIFINTHFISGAWSKHPERQERWRKHYNILYNRVATFRKYHPRKPIFVVGDFNRHKAMPMPSPVKWVPVAGVSGVPIDQMYASSTIAHSKVDRRYKWGSDHYAYRMNATF